MPVETTYVFLDTEVFDRHHHDLTSPNIERVARLVAEAEMRLVSTYVTVEEIKAHLDKLATESAKQLSNFKKVNRIVKEFLPADKAEGLDQVSEESIAEKLQVDFGKFLAATGTEVLSVDGVSPTAILEKYFQSLPPFNTTNKKAEFPDAFAGAALEAWCGAVAGRKLYIVSGDPDWKRVCDVTKGFIFVRQVGQLLETFADSEIAADLKEAVREKSEELVAFVAKQVEDGQIYFYVGDSVTDGEVNDVESIDVDLLDVYLVEAKETAATLTASFSIKVTLNVSADDPDTVYRDPDDGDLHSVGTVSGSVDREIEIDATVEVTFAAGNPKNVSITSISVPEDGIEIDVENDELSPDYDGDDDEEIEIYGPEEFDEPDGPDDLEKPDER